MKYEFNLLVKLRIAMQTINFDWFVELREQWSIYLSKIGVIKNCNANHSFTM